MSKSFEELTKAELERDPLVLLIGLAECASRRNTRAWKRVHQERKIETLAHLSGAERAQ